MKKALMIFGTVMLIALVCVAAVACDTTDKDGNNGKNDYEIATYTVTFNTNGDFVLANPVLKNVKSGSKISPPKDKNGDVIVPVKRGYTFQFWSSDGTRAFDFDNDVITKNTTLTAIYTNNVYYHTPVITAKLVYNQDGTYTVDKEGYSQNDVSLPAAELDEKTTSIKSTYNGSLANIACPSIEIDGDSFCFWYYIDDDGNPVQFTKWAKSGETNVAMLSKYYYTRGLELYPMYYSNLPRVKVVYRDSATEAVYDQTHSYALGDNIPLAERIDSPTRTGYTFDEWYYVLKDENDEDVVYDFTFAQDGADATAVADAAGIEGNFTNGELTLFARWQRKISIASVGDYMNVYNALRVQNPTDDQIKEIEEILSATIEISSIDFGGAELEPLFDKNHIFKGTIDGGTYATDGIVVSKATLSNINLKGAESVSLFGYVEGKISNFIVEGVNFAIDGNGGAFANTVYVGTLATQNGGEIANCEVRISSVNFDMPNTVVFGGICALNNGANAVDTKGYIHNCKVEIASFTSKSEGLIFGGISAQSNASSRFAKNITDIKISSVECIDDGVASNGRSSLRIGGIVANNSGTVSVSQANLVVENLTSNRETYFGGIAANNTYVVGTSFATVLLGTQSAPVSVGSSVSQVASIGGLIGKNEGAILNSHCDVKLYVKATNSNGIIALGGVVGNNFSDKTDTSTNITRGIGVINSTYAVGEIVLTEGEGVANVVSYVGGIAGRNSRSKLAQNFAIVNISVQNDGTNNVGFLFGSMENKATMTSGWYVSQNTVSVNGVVYEDGNIEGVLTGGVKIEKNKLADSNFVFDVKEGLGYSSSVWKLDGELPTLQPGIWND